MKCIINPKVDSKKQRRVQCSIIKIDDLFKKFEKLIISRNKEGVLRGVKINVSYKC
jgi:hypothetical protein